MNITEKIIARASARNSVTPGDVVFADVDKLMVHDVSGPGVIKVFEEWAKKGIELDKVWNPDRVWIAEDHFVPSADRISAENITKLTKWAQKYGIKKHFKYGLGQYGLGQCAHGHFTSGGSDDRIESTLPPVLRPKMVPRS